MRGLVALVTALILLHSTVVDAAGFARIYGSLARVVRFYSMATDPAGNVYVSGWTNVDTLTLGTKVLNRIGEVDGFVAKFDSNGNVIWVTTIAGPGAAVYGAAVAIDGAGSVYVAGSLFDADLTSPALSRIGNRDAYAMKLDAGNGAVVWARTFGGTGAEIEGWGIAANAGAVFVGGNTLTGQLTAPALPHLGDTDMFVLKLAPTDGALLWGKEFGGAGARTAGRSLALDTSGDLHVAGDFSGTLSTPLLADAGGLSIVAMKIAGVDGSVRWARAFGGPGAIALFPIIAVDGTGAPSIAASYSIAALTMPPVPWTSGMSGIFLKLDPATGSVLWTTYWDGNNARVSPTAITTDAGGNVIVTGDVSNVSNVSALQSFGPYSGFVAQFARDNGSLSWVRKLGGPVGAAYPESVASRGSDLFVGGSSRWSLTIPPIAGNGELDAFLLRMTAFRYDPSASVDGTVPAVDQPYPIGEQVTVLDNVGGLRRDGYRFAGWNTKPDGTGVAVAPGTVVAIGGDDVVLYVQWVPAAIGSDVQAIPAVSARVLATLSLLLASIGWFALRPRRRR